jgi:hypothetical protein
MEQEVDIKFCGKLGKTPTETYEMLQTDYDDKTLSIFELFKQFKDSRKDLQDDPKSRLPSAS